MKVNMGGTTRFTSKKHRSEVGKNPLLISKNNFDIGSIVVGIPKSFL